MPKRTHSGETVPILGRHSAGLLPAHLKVDLHIAPPSGDGSRPNVVAAVQPVDTGFHGRRAGKTNGRPQELSLLLRVRVVVGDDGLHRCQAPDLQGLNSSVCDVLDATWSDAAISQGLRKQAPSATGKLPRQRETVLPTATGESDAKDRRKRQKKQVPAGNETADARFSPEAPKQATPEPATKPIAATVMGNGKDGIWMPTTFKHTKAASKLTNRFAPGCHASLPCSNRSSTATYTKTLILPVDSSRLEAGGAVSGTGLNETTVGGRNFVAGWAFAHKQGPDGIVSGQLEPVGLDGEPHPVSRTRTDLRAVLAALEYRNWAKEDGVDRLVISTASYIMAKGLTSWLREWKVQQWHIGHTIPVQNRDLWQRISDVMGEYTAAGCETSVLYTPRNKFGTKIEAAARLATRQPSPSNTGPSGPYLV